MAGAERVAEIKAERERADTAIGSFEALLRTESDRADRAIAAFEVLARRLEEMAEARRRPWWQGLLRAEGRGMILSVAVALIITQGLWFIAEVLLKVR